MKYIITWLLVYTFDANHSNNAVILNKTVREQHSYETNDRKTAFDFYNGKIAEYKAQRDASVNLMEQINNPHRFEQVDEIKIDSICCTAYVNKKSFLQEQIDELKARENKSLKKIK